MATLGSVKEIVSGRVDVNSDTDPRVQVAEEIQERTTTQKPYMLDRIVGLPSGLPGRAQAEKDIISRESVLDDFIQSRKDFDNRSGDFLDGLFKAGNVALKGLSLADERVQGAVAGPVLELMDPFGKNPMDTVKSAAVSSIHGLTGKRLTRLEDLFTARLPEAELGGVDIRKPVSMIAGFGTELGMGTGLINSAKKLLTTGPKAVKKVEDAVSFAKETKNTAGKFIEKMFTGQIGNKPVNANMVSMFLKKVPEEIIDDIFKNKKVYGVVGNSIDTMQMTAKNLWKMRQALDDSLTVTDFSGKLVKKTKAVNDLVKNVSGSLQKVLNATDKAIAPAMEKYNKFATAIEKASDLLMSSKGRVKVDSLTKLAGRGADAAKQKDLQNFANIFMQGADMMKTLKALNNNRAIANASLDAMKWAYRAWVAGQVLRPVGKFISGDSGDQGGGGGGGG